jgi:hypothetical protein
MSKELFVHLFHIILVGGLFLYVSLKNATMPELMFPFLKLLGIFIIIYHSYKSYTYSLVKKSFNVNLFHIFIVAPVLLYIGYERPAPNKFVYQLLLMLAFSVIGYHGYYLILDFNKE